MKLTLSLPQEGIDAKIKAFDVEGKPISTTVARIEIEPMFYRSDAVPTVLFGVVKGGEGGKKEGQRFSVGLSGTTGKCVLKSRAEPVKPKFDRPVEAETPPVEENDEDEQENEADEDKQQDLVELPDSEEK